MLKTLGTVSNSTGVILKQGMYPCCTLMQANVEFHTSSMPSEFKRFLPQLVCHLFSTRYLSLGSGCIFILESIFLIVYQLQRALLIRSLLELWMFSDNMLLKEHLELISFYLTFAL